MAGYKVNFTFNFNLQISEFRDHSHTAEISSPMDVTPK